MFVRIGNTPRDYAWGSTTAIAGLLGTVPSGRPEAELWLGAHDGSPSVILDPRQTNGAHDLAEWIAADPLATLGAGATRLPYLLKVLAAARPLSLQAHPSNDQARAGFARENAAGIPLDSPERNYKDASHKPELIYAVSDTFEALCGYRDPARTAAAITGLAGAATAADRDAIEAFTSRLDGEPSAVLRSTTEWLLGADPSVGTLVGAVVGAARSIEHTANGDDVAAAADTARLLADAFPGEPGIVLALLLNRVTLTRGQVLSLPAGNIHAYLRGLGIELMAASDNVLRGGLTPKHIDVRELLSILDFRPIGAATLDPERPAAGVEVFRPAVPDFALGHVEVGRTVQAAPIALAGPTIALCTAGAVTITGASSSVELRRGESTYVTPDEGDLVAAGEGTVFVASPNGGAGTRVPAAPPLP